MTHVELDLDTLLEMKDREIARLRAVLRQRSRGGEREGSAGGEGDGGNDDKVQDV